LTFYREKEVLGDECMMVGRNGMAKGNTATFSDGLLWAGYPNQFTYTKQICNSI